MQEGKAALEQQMNGDTKLEDEELILESEKEEDEGDEVFGRLLALNVWRGGHQGENLQVVQMCHVSLSPAPNSSQAVPLPKHQLSVTRSQNSTGSSLGRQLAVTTMRISLTADSFRLTAASVETSCVSLAEARELMGKLPACDAGKEPFEWVCFFNFELFSSEGGIFPPRTEFSREDEAPDILPSLLCPSLNPLLHRLPPLASSLGQVERVLQLRRHRFEAVHLRRRLLLAVREGHVEDPPEIEESSALNSQRKRAITENMRQDEPLKRKKRSITISMQEEVPLEESSKIMEDIFQNPQEVKRELDRELGKLLNRYHSSCGWVSGGELREGEDCTGDSHDTMAQRTSDDGNIKNQKECNSEDKEDDGLSGPSGSSAEDQNQENGNISGTASWPL